MPLLSQDNLFGLEPEQVNATLEQEAQDRAAIENRGSPIDELSSNTGRGIGNAIFGRVLGMQRPEVAHALKLEGIKQAVESDAMNMGIDAQSDPEQFNRLVVKHAIQAGEMNLAYKAAVNAHALSMQNTEMKIKQQQADTNEQYRKDMGKMYLDKGFFWQGANATKIATTTQTNETKAAVANDTNQTKRDVEDKKATTRLSVANIRESSGQIKPIMASPNDIKTMGPVLDAAGLKFADIPNKVAAAKYVAEQSKYYQMVHKVKDPKQALSMALRDLQNNPGWTPEKGTFLGFGGGSAFNPGAGGSTTPAAPAWTPPPGVTITPIK